MVKRMYVLLVRCGCLHSLIGSEMQILRHGRGRCEACLRRFCVAAGALARPSFLLCGGGGPPPPPPPPPPRRRAPSPARLCFCVAAGALARPVPRGAGGGARNHTEPYRSNRSR